MIVVYTCRQYSNVVLNGIQYNIDDMDCTVLVSIVCITQYCNHCCVVRCFSLGRWRCWVVIGVLVAVTFCVSLQHLWIGNIKEMYNTKIYWIGYDCTKNTIMVGISIVRPSWINCVIYWQVGSDKNDMYDTTDKNFVDGRIIYDSYVDTDMLDDIVLYMYVANGSI